MLLEFLKTCGEGANRAVCGVMLEDAHANIVSSLLIIMIAWWSLSKDRWPSSYSNGIFTSNKPRRQYAISSGRVVFLPATHIFWAMLTPRLDLRCLKEISVVGDTTEARECFIPISDHSWSRNTTWFGASSSWRILTWSECWLLGTSTRCA